MRFEKVGSRDGKHDIKSEAIRNLFDGRKEIRVSALIMGYHSGVKEEEEGGK